MQRLNFASKLRINKLTDFARKTKELNKEIIGTQEQNITMDEAKEYGISIQSLKEIRNND